MSPFRDKFVTYKSIEGPSAGEFLGGKAKAKGIGTVQLSVNDQVLELKEVRYMPDIITSLISYRILEKQGFKINPKPMADGTSLFEITDTQGQSFRASADVFPLAGLNAAALAVVTRSKSKAGSKATEPGDPESKVSEPANPELADPKPTNPGPQSPKDDSEDPEPKKKRRPIYEMIEVWHSRLGHLNAASILQLAEDPRSGIGN
jgi:hypothetical protein